jgi:hypothetical protein
MGRRGWLTVFRRRKVGNCKSLDGDDGLHPLIAGFVNIPLLRL